jgi:hypothetical protein
MLKTENVYKTLVLFHILTPLNAREGVYHTLFRLRTTAVVVSISSYWGNPNFGSFLVDRVL